MNNCKLYNFSCCGVDTLRDFLLSHFPERSALRSSSQLCAFVFGAGRSGNAASALLQRCGVDVVLLDGNDEIDGRSFDFAVVSPGIPPDNRWICECVSRSIPIISELELGFILWRGRILAVTGSKGKSSVVKLCADALRLSGQSAEPCGNYGVPLCELLLAETVVEWAVLEVSSFQLERVFSFRPEIAIMLNLQSDHLDRHGSMAEYAEVKSRIFERFNPACDLAIIECEAFDSAISLGAKAIERLSAFPCREVGSLRIYGEYAFTDDELLLPHEGYFSAKLLEPAALASVIALRKAGVVDSVIKEAFSGFKPLRHRMEQVAEHNGVIYLDNSKATSLAALGAALEMANRPCRLIAGGRIKENNCDSVIKVVEKFAKKVYLIGECSQKLFDAWSHAVPCALCGDMLTAVCSAVDDAESGDAVLLAPGCASFDQFKNYSERGEAFSEAVALTLGLTNEQ